MVKVNINSDGNTKHNIINEYILALHKGGGGPLVLKIGDFD